MKPPPRLPEPRERTIRRRVVLSLTIVALLAAAGCRPPADRTAGGAAVAGESARDVTARVHGGPTIAGPATIEVEVRRDGAPVDGATVHVTGDMTHAGMVPVSDAAAPVGPGLYHTASFSFTMSGDWILTIDVTYPDGVARQVAVPLSVGR